eukprot:TRINITY_DN2910_c0_g1_i1.p2 TRINITY_DN2910_c0_g1~~TRINITY_DN2910_c0_g1_i1.p2  ORF type:complete len:274 (-),score=64.39 TRINITY_DN2910_c0_g1_i1:1483-2265(-)
MSWRSLGDDDEDDEGWGSDENNNNVFEAYKTSDELWEQAEYGFGDISLQLRFSKARCRVSDNVDDTGFSPWPSATLLGQLISTQSHLFKHKTVLELGSGTGIVGLLLAKCGVEKIVMTDKEDALLQLIQRNIDLNFGTDPSSEARKNVASCKLEWTNRDRVEDFEEVSKHLQLEDLDLVIASDVVYPQSPTFKLMATASFLLSISKKPNARFILGYEPRGKVVTELLWDTAKAAKLHGEWHTVERPVNNAKIIVFKRAVE